MMKQSKNKRKNQPTREYLIPMTKNQLERNHFQTAVCEWVHKKFSFSQNISDFHMNKEESCISQFKKKCKEIQGQYHLKHKIQCLVSYLPLQYYETLIRYIMEKKLHWTFKIQENSGFSSETIHKNMEIQMVLELKKYYKNYEYSQNALPTFCQMKSQKLQKFKPNSTMMQTSFKKSNFDFLYELLLMFSVCVTASFFQHFFTELEIDKAFRSQIYIIINHAFLDLEVSPSVFDVMEKKLCVNQNERNFQSLNASYVNGFPTSHKKRIQKKGYNPDSKRTIVEDKTKSTTTLGTSATTKILRSESKDNQTKNQISNGSNSIESKGLSSIGFSNFNLESHSKRDILIKPAMSIGYSLPSQRQNTHRANLRSHPNVIPSRFNSFLKDAKQMAAPEIFEEALEKNYFPTDEERQFCSMIKNFLHVETLPPIIKKKMNINQYQKLNEVDKVKEIKKQIKEIDQNSKYHNIKSNDLSLAMNTFISAQCGFVKKKRHQRNTHIVTNYLKGSNPLQQLRKSENRKSFTNIEQKENFQLRKLPFKASTLKFQPHKSCNFYTFNDEVLKLGQNSQKQEVLSKTVTNSIHQIQKVHEKQKSDKADPRVTPNQIQSTQFRQIFKPSHHLHETITMRENEKNKNSYKKGHGRRRQSEMNPYEQSSGIGSFASFKHVDSQNLISGTKKRISYNHIQIQQNKQVDPRESVLNTFNLSPKMQKWELGTRQVTEIELINENTNRSEDFAKFGILESEVNVNKDVTTSYKSLYKSFELKKKLRDFEANCKRRDDVSNYSMFNIKNYNDSSRTDGMMKGIKEESDEEKRKGRLSECIA